jgi:L-lysine 2,3-aminomutase
MTQQKDINDSITVGRAQDPVFVFIIACQDGDLDIIKESLKNPKVEPASNGNYAINTAYEHKYQDIVLLLWNNECVKNTLKEDNIELYNKLITLDIKEKVRGF